MTFYDGYDDEEDQYDDPYDDQDQNDDPYGLTMGDNGDEDDPTTSTLSQIALSPSTPAPSPASDAFFTPSQAPSRPSTPSPDDWESLLHPSTPPSAPAGGDFFDDLRRRGLWGEQYGSPVGRGDVQIGGGTAATPSYITSVRSTSTPGAPSAPSAAPSARGSAPAANVGLPDTMDTSSREANLRQWAPALARVEQETGLSARAVGALIIAENGGGQSPLSRDQNNYFSIAYTPGNPHQVGSQAMASDNPTMGTYKNPQDSLDNFVNLVSKDPRYARAWAVRSDPKAFFRELAAAGYVENGNGREQHWLGLLDSAVDQYTNIAGSVKPAPEVSAQARDTWEAPTSAKGVTPSQASYALNSGDGDGWAMCSEFAAAGQLASLGIQMDPAAMKPTARKYGWTAEAGQAGPQAHVNMVNDLLAQNGSDARAVYQQGIDWQKVAQEVKGGRPVVLNAMSTAGKIGHYFVVEDFDPSTGRYYLGNSLLSLKAGNGQSGWVTPQELNALQAVTSINMQPDGAIYLQGGAPVRQANRTSSPPTAAPTAPAAPTVTTTATMSPGSPGTAPAPIRANIGNRPLTLTDIAFGTWDAPAAPPPPPPKIDFSQMTPPPAQGAAPAAVPEWRQRAAADARARAAAPKPTAPAVPDIDREALAKEQDAAAKYQADLDAYLQRAQDVSRKNVEIERGYQEDNSGRLVRGETTGAAPISTYGDAGDEGPSQVTGLGTEAGEDRPAYYEYPEPPKPPTTPNLDKLTAAANKKKQDEWQASGADPNARPQPYLTPAEVAARANEAVNGIRTSEQRVADEYGTKVGEARQQFLQQIEADRQRQVGRARAAAYVPPNEYANLLDANAAQGTGTVPTAGGYASTPDEIAALPEPSAEQIEAARQQIRQQRVAQGQDITDPAASLSDPMGGDSLPGYQGIDQNLPEDPTTPVNERTVSDILEAQGLYTPEAKGRLRGELAQTVAVNRSNQIDAEQAIRRASPAGYVGTAPDLRSDFGSGVRDIQGTIGAGLMGLANTLNVAGANIDPSSLQEYGAGLMDSAQQANRVEAYDPRQAGLLDQTVRAAPSVLAGIAVAVPLSLGLVAVGAPAAAVTAAGLGANVVSTFLQEGGDAYQDAIKSGASPSQASAALLIKGSANAAIEMSPIGEAISKIPGGGALKDAIGKRIAALAAPVLASRMGRSFAGQALISVGTEVVPELVKNFLAEGGQEWVQEAVGIAVENLYRDSSFHQLLEERGLQSFLVGGALGAVTEVAGQGLEHVLPQGAAGDAVLGALEPERSGTTPEGRFEFFPPGTTLPDGTTQPGVGQSASGGRVGLTGPQAVPVDPAQAGIQDGLEMAEAAANGPRALLGTTEPLLRQQYDAEGFPTYNQDNLTTGTITDWGSLVNAHTTESEGIRNNTATEGERVREAVANLATMEGVTGGLNADQRASLLEDYGVWSPDARTIAAQAAYHISQRPEDGPAIHGVLNAMFGGRANASQTVRTFQNRANAALASQAPAGRAPQAAPAPQAQAAAAAPQPAPAPAYTPPAHVPGLDTTVAPATDEEIARAEAAAKGPTASAPEMIAWRQALATRLPASAQARIIDGHSKGLGAAAILGNLTPEERAAIPSRQYGTQANAISAVLRNHGIPENPRGAFYANDPQRQAAGTAFRDWQQAYHGRIARGAAHAILAPAPTAAAPSPSFKMGDRVAFTAADGDVEGQIKGLGAGNGRRWANVRDDGGALHQVDLSEVRSVGPTTENTPVSGQNPSITPNLGVEIQESPQTPTTAPEAPEIAPEQIVPARGKPKAGSFLDSVMQAVPEEGRAGFRAALKAARAKKPDKILTAADLVATANEHFGDAIPDALRGVIGRVAVPQQAPAPAAEASPAPKGKRKAAAPPRAPSVPDGHRRVWVAVPIGRGDLRQGEDIGAHADDDGQIQVFDHPNRGGVESEFFDYQPIVVPEGDIQRGEHGRQYLQTRDGSYTPARAGVTAADPEARGKAEQASLAVKDRGAGRDNPGNIDQISGVDIPNGGGAMFFQQGELSQADREAIGQSESMQTLGTASKSLFSKIQGELRTLFPNLPTKNEMVGMAWMPMTMGLTSIKRNARTLKLSRAQTLLNPHSMYNAALKWASKVGVAPNSEDFRRYLAGLHVGTLVHEILHTLPDDATLDETGHGGSHAQAIRRALDELDIAALQREAYQSWTPDVMAEVQQQLGTLEDSVGADMKAVEAEVNLLLDRMKDTPNAEDGFMVPKGADAEAVKGMIASRLDELGLSDTLQPFDEDGFFVGVRPITEEAAAPAQPAAAAVATEEPPLAPERAAPPRRKPDQGVAGGLRLLDADQEVSFGNKRAASMNMTLAQHVGNVAFEGDTPTPQAMSGRTTADMGERLDRKNAALERLKAETQKAKRRAGHRIATLSDTFAAMKVMEDEYPTLSDRVAEAMKLNGYTYTDQYGELQQVVFPHAERATAESRARAQRQNDGKAEEAIRAFGTTEDPLDAMFVLPDGTMIKIPGERGDYGHQSHAEIGRLYPSLSPHQAVSQFRADAGALQWSLFGKAGQRVLAITGESPLSPAQQRLILSEGRYADDVVSTIDGQSRFFDPATQRADFGRFIRDKGDTHAEADRSREPGPGVGPAGRGNEDGESDGADGSGRDYARAQRLEPARLVRPGAGGPSRDANVGGSARPDGGRGAGGVASRSAMVFHPDDFGLDYLAEEASARPSSLPSSFYTRQRPNGELGSLTIDAFQGLPIGGTGIQMFFQKGELGQDARQQIARRRYIEKIGKRLEGFHRGVTVAFESLYPGEQSDSHFQGIAWLQSEFGVTRGFQDSPQGRMHLPQIYVDVHTHFREAAVWAEQNGYRVGSPEFKQNFGGELIGTMIHEVAHTIPFPDVDDTGHGGGHGRAIARFYKEVDLERFVKAMENILTDEDVNELHADTETLQGSSGIPNDFEIRYYEYEDFHQRLAMLDDQRARMEEKYGPDWESKLTPKEKTSWGGTTKRFNRALKRLDFDALIDETFEAYRGMAGALTTKYGDGWMDLMSPDERLVLGKISTAYERLQHEKQGDYDAARSVPGPTGGRSRTAPGGDGRSGSTRASDPGRGAPAAGRAGPGEAVPAGEEVRSRVAVLDRRDESSPAPRRTGGGRGAGGYVPGANVRRNNRGEVASHTRPPRRLTEKEFWSPSQGKILRADSQGELSLYATLESAMHVENPDLSEHGLVVEWRSTPLVRREDSRGRIREASEQSVRNWDGSPLSFSYADQGKVRGFNPDILVAYEDGHQEIIEIKRTDAPQEEDDFFRSEADRRRGKARLGWHVKGKVAAIIADLPFVNEGVETGFRIIAAGDPLLTGRPAWPSQQKFLDFYNRVNELAATLPYREDLASITDPDERRAQTYIEARKGILDADQRTFASTEGSYRAAPTLGFISNPEAKSTSWFSRLGQIVPNASQILEAHRKYGLSIDRVSVGESPTTGDRMGVIAATGDIEAAQLQVARLAQAAGTADDPRTYVFHEDSRGTDFIHSVDTPLADDMLSSALASFNDEDGPTVTAIYGPDGTVERVVMSSRTPNGGRLTEDEFNEERDDLMDALREFSVGPENDYTAKGFITHFNDPREGGVDNAIARRRESLGELPLGRSTPPSPATTGAIPIGNPRGRPARQYVAPEPRAGEDAGDHLQAIPDFGQVRSRNEHVTDLVRRNPDITRRELQALDLGVSDGTLKTIKNLVAREARPTPIPFSALGPAPVLGDTTPAEPSREEAALSDEAERVYARVQNPQAPAAPAGGGRLPQVPNLDLTKFSREGRAPIRAAAISIMASGGPRAYAQSASGGTTQDVRDVTARAMGISRKDFSRLPASGLSDIELAAVHQNLTAARANLDAMSQQIVTQPTQPTNDQLRDFIQQGIRYQAMYKQLTGSDEQIKQGSRLYTKARQNTTAGETAQQHLERLLGYARTSDKKGKHFTRSFVAQFHNGNMLGATPHQIAVAWDEALNPKTNIGDWMVATVYNSMLGPLTATAATVWNSAEVLWRGLRDLITTGLRGLNPLDGSITPSDASKILYSEAGGLLLGMGGGLKAAYQTILHGATSSQLAVTDLPPERLQRNNKLLGVPGTDVALNKVGWAMETFFGRFFSAADAFGRVWSYSMELGRQAALESQKLSRDGRVDLSIAAGLYQDPRMEMRNKAARVATESVFQGEMGAFGERMAGLQNYPVVGRVVLPFLRTIYHGQSRAIDRTPIGMLATLIDGYRTTPGRNALDRAANMARGQSAYFQGKDTHLNAVRPAGERFIDGVMGTVAFYAISQAIEKGLIELTGQPPDDEQEKLQWQREHKIAYGIRINGGPMVSYANWGVPSYGLLAMAEHQTYLRKRDTNGQLVAMGQAIHHFAKGALDFSYFQTLANLMSAAESSDRDNSVSAEAKGVVEDWVTSRIPFGALGMTIGQTQDPYVRYPDSKDLPRRLAQDVSARLPVHLPFWETLTGHQKVEFEAFGQKLGRETLHPQLDVFGFPVENTRYQQGAMGAVNPFRYATHPTADPVDGELARLKAEEGLDKLPSKAPPKYNNHEFNEDELFEWRRRVGQDTYARLNWLFQQPAYKAAPTTGDGSKDRMIDAQYTAAKDTAWDSLGIVDVGEEPKREPKYYGIKQQANKAGVEWWQYEKRVDDAISKWNDYRDALKTGRKPPALTPEEARMAAQYSSPGMRNKAEQMAEQKGRTTVKKVDDQYPQIPFNALPPAP